MCFFLRFFNNGTVSVAQDVVGRDDFSAPSTSLRRQGRAERPPRDGSRRRQSARQGSSSSSAAAAESLAAPAQSGLEPRRRRCWCAHTYVRGEKVPAFTVFFVGRILRGARNCILGMVCEGRFSGRIQFVRAAGGSWRPPPRIHIPRLDLFLFPS